MVQEDEDNKIIQNLPIDFMLKDLLGPLNKANCEIQVELLRNLINLDLIKYNSNENTYTINSLKFTLNINNTETEIDIPLLSLVEMHPVLWDSLSTTVSLELTGIKSTNNSNSNESSDNTSIGASTGVSGSIGVVSLSASANFNKQFVGKIQNQVTEESSNSMNAVVKLELKANKSKSNKFLDMITNIYEGTISRTTGSSIISQIQQLESLSVGTVNLEEYFENASELIFSLIGNISDNPDSPHAEIIDQKTLKINSTATNALEMYLVVTKNSSSIKIKLEIE